VVSEPFYLNQRAVFKSSLQQQRNMTPEGNFVQPVIPRFDCYYDHWSMLMENFLRSKEYWGLIKNGYVETESGHRGDKNATKED
jgi:hypothetical protein